MDNSFHLSYVVLGVSILNLIMVVACLLLVYFEWSAARRRELLYLVLTEEKPGQSYFAAARRRRALYTRLLLAFLVLTAHQFIAANLFATVSEPYFYRSYLNWWRTQGGSVFQSFEQSLHVQVWWNVSEVLALILLSTGLLYEVRSQRRAAIDWISIVLVAAWVVLVGLVLKHIVGLGGGESWSPLAFKVLNWTFWLRIALIAGVLGALLTQNQQEHRESAFSRSVLLLAFSAWMIGALLSRVSPVDLAESARFVAAKDRVKSLEKQREFVPLTQLEQEELTQKRELARFAPNPLTNLFFSPGAISLGCTIAFALLLMMITHHVLTEYEVMERSRHRLGRERQVIIQFLQRIGSAFSSAPELETVLNIILDSTIDTTEAHAAAIYLYDRETKKLGPPVVRHFFPPLYTDTSPAYDEHHGGATEVLLAQAMRQTFALDEGIIGEVASSGKARLIADVRAEGIVQGKTTQYFRDYSMLVAPLRVRDEPQAVIAVLQKQRGSFNAVDQALLQALADQGALGITHVRLLTEVREQERLKRELQIAHDIQQRLLPDRCPNVPGFEIGAYGAAATEVGGDYYDFFEVDSDHLGIVVADVSGKGVHACLVVAMMRSAFRIQAKNNLDVKDVLQSVNDFIGNDLPRDMFITCVYGILEVSTRRFTWARAGHEPLILAHLDDSTDVLAPAGFALGVLGSPDFDQMLEVNSLILQPGDRILLFTDGLTEAMNAEGEEFGMQRILRVLSHADPASAPAHSNGMNGHSKKVRRPEPDTLSARQSPMFSTKRAEGDPTSCDSQPPEDDPIDLLSMERAVENHVDGASPSDDLTMVFLAVK